MKLLHRLVTTFVVSATLLCAMPFVHPGALNSQQELDFVRQMIQQGAQPWRQEFDLLRRSSYATRTPHALTHVNSAGGDAEISRDDAIAAYSQALLWYYSGEERYARSAMEILNAWSALEGFTAATEQDRLQAGWLGAVLAPAAEILRLYPGWSRADIGRLQTMFRRAFYPQLKTASHWNGNVDLTQIDAMLAISVFNEDEALFQAGLQRLKNRTPAYFYLSSDGPSPKSIQGDGGDLNKFWHHPLKWVDGLTQETCRDNGHHTQFALGSAIHAAEVAWHQGVDIYSENKARYTAAMELLAKQLLTGSMQGLSRQDAASPNRYNTWEVAYNHYHNRAGLDLPYTRRLIIEQIRPLAPRTNWNLNYETLTHAELDSVSPSQRRK